MKVDKLKTMLGTSVERIKDREAHKLEKKEQIADMKLWAKLKKGNLINHDDMNYKEKPITKQVNTFKETESYKHMLSASKIVN